MNEKIMAVILEQMQEAVPKWKELIDISFLSEEMKEKYFNLLETRLKMF
ncbi:hypothetical protein [Sinomicrobium sp. M5D2P9]